MRGKMCDGRSEVVGEVVGGGVERIGWLTQ